MRVSHMFEYGPPSVLRESTASLPQPNADEVRVRVRAAGVNPADYKWRSGMFAEVIPLQFPHILGYDIAGTVDAVGANVTRFQVGDPVFTMLDNLVKGGYAEFAVCAAAHVAHMPAGLDFDIAAALPTAALTGFQMIEEQIQPLDGQTILITGATGAVGRYATLAACQRGARVVAAVRSSQQSEARALGAAETLVLGEQQWNGPAFDHIADTVGGPLVAELCKHLLPGGHIRTVSTTPIDPTGLATEPVFFAVQPDAARLEAIGQLVSAGAIDVPIAHRLPLSQAAEAHRLAEAGGLGGKLILIP